MSNLYSALFYKNSTNEALNEANEFLFNTAALKHCQFLAIAKQHACQDIVKLVPSATNVWELYSLAVSVSRL